jgi:hypothetical protein
MRNRSFLSSSHTTRFAKQRQTTRLVIQATKHLISDNDSSLHDRDLVAEPSRAALSDRKRWEGEVVSADKRHTTASSLESRSGVIQ